MWRDALERWQLVQLEQFESELGRQVRQDELEFIGWEMLRQKMRVTAGPLLDEHSARQIATN